MSWNEIKLYEIKYKHLKFKLEKQELIELKELLQHVENQINYSEVGKDIDE